MTTLRFQSTERQAWLVELDDNAARTQGDLCQRHAAALVLPRGWDLHDERASAVSADAGAPAAVPDASTAEKAGHGNGARRTKAKRKAPIETVSDAHQLPGLEPAAAAAGDDKTAGNGPPRSALVPFGDGDEEEVDDALEAILDARTPLLQRAFRNARPL